MKSQDLWKERVAIFRSRFVAREDIFSQRREYTQREVDPNTNAVTFKEGKSIRPSCQNDDKQNLCLILQRKGGCQECSNRILRPLDEEWIIKHLNGESELILYMLRAEGVRFGCADFDKGNTFEDALKVKELSLGLGIPCYIAKSTKKGYHLYWFFEDYVPADVFNSWIRHLFETLGFYERFFLNPEIGLPEVFPKQVTFDNKLIGNGIKVPMMEPRVREGRNCWVMDDGTPITVENQWEYLQNTKLINVVEFNKVLEDQKVEIIKAPATRNKKQARKMAGITEDGEEATAPFRPIGDFWHVVEGCPAMREYWARNEIGEYLWDKSNPKGLFNAARLASMNIALSTINGEEEIKRRWPTRNTEGQINSAKSKGYLPVTCRFMQDNGICHKNRHPRFGDHCLKKNPPVEYENGTRVVNPENLPEEEWPEPSPIRYANDNHLSVEEVIERLSLIYTSKKAVAEQKIEIDPKNGQPMVKAAIFVKDILERAKQLVKRAKILGEEELSRVSNAIKTNKWMKVGELKDLLKSIGKELDEQRDTRKRESTRSFTHAGIEYFLENNSYVRVFRDSKGNRQEVRMTNFAVFITEEVETLQLRDKDDLNTPTLISAREYSGYVAVSNQKIPFKVDSGDWSGSADSMFKTLTKFAGSEILYQKSDFDSIRNCINHFSKEDRVIRRRVKDIGHHKLDGKSVYIMPSVIVYKDEIKENHDFIVEFNTDTTRGLDFSIMSLDRFKSLCVHIIKDYFECNNAMLTMTCFAHAMAAAITPQLAEVVKFNKSPILWLAGSFGGGKTFVAENAQFFYGVFSSILSASGGTSNARIATGHTFRNAMMAIDDYKKSLQPDGGRDFNKFIQMAYDRTGNNKLQRNGQQRAVSEHVRGLVTVTGEDLIENEASAISRLILVDSKVTENREAGDKVTKNREFYNGFTPYFIQFVYSLTPSEIAEVWNKYYSELYTKEIATQHKKESAGRVCENLTLNMVAFDLALSSMVAHGAIPELMKQEQCRIHKTNLENIRTTTFKAIETARGSETFLDSLRELLQNRGKYYIQDMPVQDPSSEYIPTTHATCLGFYREGVVFIYPTFAVKAVSDLVRGNNSYIQSMSHIARQMHESDYFVANRIGKDGKRYVCKVRAPGTGGSVSAWPLKAEVFGILANVNAPMKNYALGENFSDNVTEADVF